MQNIDKWMEKIDSGINVFEEISKEFCILSSSNPTVFFIH